MTRRVITIMLVAAVFAALTPLYAQWTNPVAEDFNSEWSTTSPPPGWTINYDGTVGSSDWHPYYWSQTGSDCAYIYWSPSETGTDELISPVFDCSAADMVYVAATHWFSHYATPYTAQWVGSIDGGETFPYVLFDYNYTSYGPARDSILFPEAAGEENVCINFLLDGYSYNINYWYVDDVAVWIHESGGGPGGCDDLIYEQFNGSWTTASPPAGWTIVYNTPADVSDWFNGGWGGSTTAQGVPTMVYYGDYGYVQTDEFVSPTLDCSGYDNVYIAFDHEYSHYSGTYENQILGSTNGGDTWNYVVWDYANSSSAQRRDSFDITDWAAGESQVAFNWHCYGDPWYMNNRGFDNVRVTACTEGVVPPPELDLQMIQIIRPYDEEEGGVAFVPRCRILNPTQETVEAEIRCQMKNINTLQTVYNDVHNSYPLDPGYNDVGGFKYFTPEGNTTYEALFVVDNTEDVNPHNNDATKQFTTVAGKDVTPFEMVAPQDSIFLPFTPKAKFEERAGAPETDAWCHCKIENMAAYGAQVYHDSTMITFSAGEIKEVVFSEIRTDNTDFTPGSYTITFWAADDRAANISDPDFFVQSFYIKEAVVEAPVVSAFGLSVVNNTVNFSLAKATDVSL
ncbi:hypothetical protein JXM67_07545, partial [candidate division WOR-3 bacterium]|nr:hypothetical protein [candidate division WOR-3 bacterium]